MPKRKTRAEKIAALNDAFRKNLPSGLGRVYLTAGINALGAEFAAKCLARVAGFDAFTPDNDPYGERDFGAFDVDGAGGNERCFWKIDYYDLAGEFGSEDPTDPRQTLRVLTIMLAEEY